MKKRYTNTKARLLEMMERVNKVKINESLTQATKLLDFAIKNLIAGALQPEKNGSNNTILQSEDGESFITIDGTDANNNSYHFRFKIIGEDDGDASYTVSDVDLIEFSFNKDNLNIELTDDSAELEDFNKEHGAELYDAIEEYVGKTTKMKKDFNPTGEETEEENSQITTGDEGEPRDEKNIDSLKESVEGDKYENVVFLQGDEAQEPLRILNDEGEDAAIEYLKQWHQPGNHEGNPTIGAGTNDNVYEKDGYVLVWNDRLGYIGLEYDLSHLDEEIDKIGEIVLPDANGEYIEGGLADGHKPDEYDSAELGKGIQVEMEHTNDPKVALEIAMDHLQEIPDYYTRLDQMEKEAGVEDDEEGAKETELPEKQIDPPFHLMQKILGRGNGMGMNKNTPIPPEERCGQNLGRNKNMPVDDITGKNLIFDDPELQKEWEEQMNMDKELENEILGVAPGMTPNTIQNEDIDLFEEAKQLNQILNNSIKKKD